MNNQSIIQDISFIGSNWFKRRYFKNKSKYKTSRYLIAISINHLFERDERQLCKQNNNLHQSIEKTNQQKEILQEKLNTLNNISILFHIPLNIRFEQRMTRLRHSAEQHMTAVQQEVRDEVEYWKNIHSILSQPLLEPGLIRSYHDGSPQQQYLPSETNTICEENKKSIRCLAPISTFSILSNGINQESLSMNKFNKTFVKAQSSINNSFIDDENLTSAKLLKTFVVYKNISDSESDSTEDTIIFVE